MKKYLVFNETLEARNFSASMDGSLGYPLDARTLTHCELIDHPSNGKVAVLFCGQDCLPFLSQTEKDASLTLDQFKALNWFPMPEELQ